VISVDLNTVLAGSLDDDAWDDLLNFIEEKRVIPIVGPELLQVETADGPRLLYDWLAEKLAARLNVDTSALPRPFTLNDVVCWFLSARGRREEAYVRLRSIVREANFQPPRALRRLAAITDFDLYVSTTFDPLLESAINLERFGGMPSTDVLSYAPNRVADLAGEREALQRPVVYHLLGRLSASPTYVISDEDLLDFICASRPACRSAHRPEAPRRIAARGGGLDRRHAGGTARAAQHVTLAGTDPRGGERRGGLLSLPAAWLVSCS
jgi:hypothetical protein